MSGTLAEVLGDLPAISLEGVLDAAELMQRTDRKYLLAPQDCADVLSCLVESGHERRILEIDGRRGFGYESVYFDTARLDSYHLSARGRRHRFKVRTRSYLDSRTCMLEVKTRGHRDQTLKERVPHPWTCRATVTERAREFVDQRVPALRSGAELRSVLTTTYTRATVVDPVAGTRMTIDAALECRTPDGTLARAPGLVLVESKGPGAPTALDRALWATGHRPVSLSKFGTGLAAVDPALPANKWARTLRRHFVTG